MHTTGQRLLIAVAAAVTLTVSGCAGDGGDEAATATDPPVEQDGATSSDAASGDTESGDTGASDPEEEPTASGTGDAEGTAAAAVAVATSELGDIVVDGDGRTLYLFVPDEGGEPTCVDDCAAAWPVFEGPATAGDGADDTLLSTVAHPSGATQATYGGWPLYHFASDAAPGDVNGQGINDVWFVVGPDGEPVRDAAAAIGAPTGY